MTSNNNATYNASFEGDYNRKRKYFYLKVDLIAKRTITSQRVCKGVDEHGRQRNILVPPAQHFLPSQY